jgi:hypothetical protein
VLFGITKFILKYSHIQLITITDQATIHKRSLYKSSLNTNVQFILLEIISVIQFHQATQRDQACMYLFLLNIHKLTMQAYKKDYFS